jgi:hypothetical protein
MIVVISFLLNLMSPIVNILGFLGVGCAWLMDDNMEVLIMTAVAVVVGLIFGIFAYRNDIPPRMFWTGSVNDIFEFSVTAVLGYAFNIAMYPPCVYFIMRTIEEVA